MQKIELLAISEKVSDGTASEKEMALFLFHLNSYADEYPAWDEVPLAQKNEIEGALRVALHEGIFKTVTHPVRRNLLLWPGIAAAVVLIVLSFLYLQGTIDFSRHKTQSLAANDIGPGTNGAILKLANGELMDLSAKKSGVLIDPIKLTYSDGTEIASKGGAGNTELPAIAGKNLEMMTGRGQTYSVILSDGTKVWLNAESKLNFPVAFAQRGQRLVELFGEAYFEVSRDSARPFIVKSKTQQVRVLGTHFNITAYQNEKIVKTTLLEGSVAVFSLDHSTLLKPGEQAQVADHAIKIAKNIDMEDAVAWKDGYFKFHESLEEIMAKISRWYNVDVEYQIKPDPGLTFSGKISRTRSISGILKMLEYNGDVHFKVEGRRIIVTK